MRPLHVAVIVKAGRPAALERDNRATGLFSYGVDEFTFDYVPLTKNTHVDSVRFNNHYDLIFHYDGPLELTFNNLHIPYVYYSIDSSLSIEHHYLPRYHQAQHADMVLIDHDRLDRFMVSGRNGSKVFRLSHCVNDKVFYDYGLPKTVDVAFHCNNGGSDDTRSKIRQHLHEVCKNNGWKYASGALGLQEYARSMNAAKVTVNWPRTPANRPHRVFDSLACRTCLLTGPLPDVSDEFRVGGLHYYQFEFDDLHASLTAALQGDSWKRSADAGYEMVMKHHVWSIRARELRELLHVELGL